MKQVIPKRQAPARRESNPNHRVLPQVARLHQVMAGCKPILTRIIVQTVLHS